jgi:hypothetical protein
MQDKRRRGKNGNVVDQAAERAIQTAIQDLPLEEQFALLRRLRDSLGELLSTAPLQDGKPIEDMANRAKLAAAFRVRLPSDEG